MAKTKEEIALRKKEWRLRNLEKCRLKGRQNYHKNKEQIKIKRDAEKEKIKEYHKEYYLKNKDKINKRNREYDMNNREKIRESKRKLYNRDLKITRKKERNNRLKFAYGITLDDYNNMLLKQNNCCYICKKHQLELKKGLAVDHCHTTGKVRGLLCHNCNSALGMAKENKEILRAMIFYLEEFNKPEQKKKLTTDIVYAG